jgi:aconitate hydratase
LIGAINIENGEANKIQNKLTGEWGAVPTVAEWYKNNGKKWIVIGMFDLFPENHLCPANLYR